MIRTAKKEEINEINVIRKQVNDLHANGEPTLFKSGFSKELQDHINNFFDTENKWVLVCKDEGKICGYVMLEIITKPETPYRYEQSFLEVNELGALNKYQGKGYGKLLMQKVKEIAQEKNINRIELDAWNFNEKALNFYKKLGFETYREYLRFKI